MKIVIVTDAWHPQVNGVVRTLETTGKHLRELGHQVEYITPEGFKSFPCPTYPDIRLAWLPGREVARLLRAHQPAAIHIATEGPLGWAARAWCRKNGFPFTTSYHTQFPEYVRMRAPIPLAVSYAVVRHFHGPAVRTMVPTETQRQRLLDNGFDDVVVWSRGVDTSLFHPRDKSLLDHLPRPIMTYVGRVAVEKSLEDLLRLDHPGSKLIVGDGPDFDKLKSAYPDAHFVGFKHGEELAAHIAASDVFVFPSRTDTFGLVLLEAMASGIPVAAYPVTGPIDVIAQGRTGVLDEDLAVAVRGALKLSARDCVDYARGYSWQSVAEAFLGYLQVHAPEQADRLAA